MLRAGGTSIAMSRTNLWNRPLRSIGTVLQINRKRLSSFECLQNVFLLLELSETHSPRVELHMFSNISCTFSGIVLDFKQLKSRYNTSLSELFWA